VQIDHITFSKTGGAGIVANTLAKAQSDMGHDVSVLTILDSDLRSQPFKKPILTVAAAFDHWALSSHREKTLFSPLRGNLESLDHSKFRQDSIIHLHWIPGVITHQRVMNLLDSGRKLVWTLHDTNPFTGGCHHSHECEQFTEGCSRCPQAKNAFRGIVSINLQRRRLERKYPNLRIVSPTAWMLGQATRSTVFREQENLVIANPIEEIFFRQINRSTARENFVTAVDKFVGAVVAKDLSDANKNLSYVIRAFEEAALRTSRKLALFLVGKNGVSYTSKIVEIIWLGELTSEQITENLRGVDVLLSGSIAESAGMTIIEAAAMGIPSVALANGGTSSLIQNRKTGILCEDSDSFASGLMELIEDTNRVLELGASAKVHAENHRATLIATQYIELYSSMY